MKKKELRAAINELTEELILTEKLLAESNKVLSAIPECPLHGNTCIPHAIEWINEMIEKLANQERHPRA